uniref:Methyltransferase domain-containing protein n=1 Tax=Ignisphaera aggregans TaxID=334771 RepID=A0A7C2VGR3_9CREN
MVKSKKELEILLSRAPGFVHPSIFLEQYVTDSSTASELIWIAYMRRDIEDKVVVDLGCGTGVLSYGALLMGAKEVVCMDLDVDALKTARDFLKVFSPKIHLVNADVALFYVKKVETVIMNPPFGIHRRGADILFLKKALELKPSAIYTIHKYNPQSHIVISRLVQRHGYSIAVMVVRNMHIPAIYPMHRRRIHHFRVALYAISRSEEL